METIYRSAANALLVLHFAYVAFVVIGFAVILLGLALGKGWARNPWLRWLHLLAIVVVAGEAMLDITCPLTAWEHQLRHLAGQTVVDVDFIAAWLHKLMFFELPSWVFTTAYISFGAAVLLVFLWFPPRRRRRQSAPV